MSVSFLVSSRQAEITNIAGANGASDASGGNRTSGDRRKREAVMERVQLAWHNRERLGF